MTDDIDLYQKYIGVCFLLSRLSNQIHDQSDRYTIERALEDCVNKYPDRFEVQGTCIMHKDI